MKGKDNLNLHEYFIYVIRKDGHYDAIYNKDHIQFMNLENLRANDEKFLKIFTNKKEEKTKNALSNS